jgi:dihydrofolate reductase
MLIVSNIVSLDGYVAAADGNSTVLPMDDAFDAYNAERLRSADTLLVGANTYPGFAAFWPMVLREPERAADAIVAQTGMDRAEVLARLTTGASGEVARLNDRIAKVVVSDTLTEADLGAWRDSTTIVRRADAAAHVAALAGEAVTFGSRTTWNALLAAGVVDELHLMVGPVALGSGVPAFAGPAPALELVDTRRFTGSQNVLLRYAVTRR